MNWSRAAIIWMSLSDPIVAGPARLPRWRSKLLPLRDLMSIQVRCGDLLVALGRLGAPTRPERGISAGRPRSITPSTRRRSYQCQALFWGSGVKTADTTIMSHSNGEGMLLRSHASVSYTHLTLPAKRIV